MHTIYINENIAVQVESAKIAGSLYKHVSYVNNDKYMWIPQGRNVPGGFESYGALQTLSTTHMTIWFNNISTVKEAVIKFIATYNNSSVDIWSDDEVHYASYKERISNIEFDRYIDVFLPDTASLRSLFPNQWNDGERASISVKLYIVNKNDNNTEAATLEEQVEEPFFTFSINDPNKDIVGIEAVPNGNHIDVTITTSNVAAFAKKHNKGYACYTITQYTHDGMVDTSGTITGVAERRKVRSDKYLISLDSALADSSLAFAITPSVLDISVSEVVIEASAAFWYDDNTSLADKHTGILDTNAVYITRDPVSLADKIPLSNGFYDVTWDDALVVYAGSAANFVESHRYDHVPGPSSLNVYNCIKVSSPNENTSKTSGYTLFKVNVDKEQAISTPTSIIVPYHDVICTVGVAALENIENQADTTRNDIWTSQK